PITEPHYYLVRSNSTCDDALDAAIDTVGSIFLTVTDNGATAGLNWTPVSTPTRPSSNGIYTIYKESPASVWTEIGKTTDLFWSDPVTVCDELVNYRVELEDNLPCTSVSNVAGAILKNGSDPEPQKIDSVTVDLLTQLAHVFWTANGDSSVTEYHIEQNETIGGTSAWGAKQINLGYNNTDWINPDSKAETEAEYYRVKAKKECSGLGLPGQFHRTVHVAVVVDSCEKFTTLSWNAYEGWRNGIDHYEIYAAVNGGAETKIGTTADTVLTFSHFNLIADGNYCYRVRTVQNNPAARITSSSNQACIRVYVPKRPEYGYNYKATVLADNSGVTDYFFVDSTAGYLGFELHRSTGPDNLVFIADIPFNPNTRYHEFTDNTVRPEYNSYYYTVIGIDSCNLNVDTLNISRTVLLQAEANTDERKNTLRWNAYEGWRGGVSGYNIYRNSDGVYELIATVPAKQLSYVDTIAEIIIGEGRFCYYIEAIEGIGPAVGTTNPVQFKEVSRSNESCALQLPNVFIPNAFVPDGVNQIMKPVTVYVDYTEYLFQVYNRWGQKVFETTDPALGWDGTFGGNEARQGVYAYFIRFIAANGEKHTKSGSITLIR
ncbi:gliding motility-associated C-terminal domain-containing protein, partial [Bacteroidota bacterium]